MPVSLLSDDAVAVVGAACRLPGDIHGLDDLWGVLATGRDVVGEVPPDRFLAEDFVDASRRRPGWSYTAAGGFLRDITGFDASFFTGISPREASQMDPQQRLLLELAVEALDDAGIDWGRLEGSDTAVFVGCSSRDYGDLQACAPESGNAYSVSGVAGAIAANRLSHCFDWHGQSVTVDTACSSALTALHQACEEVRSGRARMAVAGGANVLINPRLFAGFSAASMLSPTGRCRPFSARADGFVRAEGGGLVLLKRLSDARADGDRIHGVIVATGVNNDGRTPGLALPSSAAQQALLTRLYEGAGLVADDVAYLEAHGTGTQVGDPLECEAIGRALGVGRSRGPLPVGSVKSNIGHMEAASGMAGLLKALLVLKHRQIPATLHAEELNQKIDFEQLGLRPVTRTEPLGAVGLALAGVNSFGFGGANAHAVLAGADLVGLARTPTDAHLGGPLPVVVSARTAAALKDAAEALGQHLQFTAAEGFYDLAYTSAVRRRRHEHRAGVVAQTPQEAAEALLRLAAGEDDSPAAVTMGGQHGGTAFVFSGNGSQWAGMGADLLEREPVFAAAVRAVDAELYPQLGWSVVEEMAAGCPRLARTEVAQPLLFAVQLGVVRLLAEHGVQPDTVVGHSVGEIAAAHVSGSLSLAQACQVVAVRSKAQGATAGNGRMAAVGLSREEAVKELASHHGRLEVAGVNSDRDVTIAGRPDALAELGRQLEAREVFFRELDLDYAFHSSAMDGIRGEVTDALASLRPAQHRTRFASTVTGGLLDGTHLDAAYWWRNVRMPVLFADAVRALTEAGCTRFVEIGPHAVLAAYLRRLAPDGTVVPSMRRGQDGPSAVRRAAATLLAADATPSARCFPRPGRVVSLPGYSWQHERHYHGSADSWASVPQDKALAHPLLGRRAAVAEPAWHQTVSDRRLPWLADHQVDGTVVMPATAYAEAALAAGRQTWGAACEVTDLDIVRPLTLPRPEDPTEVAVQTSLSLEDGIVCFASRTGSAGEWTLHARARVRRMISPPPALENSGTCPPHGALTIEASVHYAHTDRAGLAYGPSFQVLTGLWLGEGEAGSQYRLPENLAGACAGYEAHPVILDGALQTAAPLLAQAADARMFLPIGFESLRVWQPPRATGRIHVRLRHLSGADALVDVTVTGPDGEIAARLTGCRLRAVSTGTSSSLQELATVLRASPWPGPQGADAVALPAPAGLAAATAAERVLLEQDQVDDYPLFARLSKKAASHWATAAFATLTGGAQEFSCSELVATHQVRPHFLAYTRLMAEMAAHHGLLEEVSGEVRETGNERWRFTGVPADPCAQTRVLADRCPQWITAIALHARFHTHLIEVLTGATDIRELVFNEADRRLAEAFYGDTPQMRLYARFAGSLLQYISAQWPTGRPLRVLEVGAGTGSLAAALLPALPPHLARYTFSDISASFFPRAQSRFRGFDFVDYRVLDLNEEPAEQGFEPGSYDLVVASNVLHATADLRATLRRLASLLDQGGQLLAIESHDEEMIAPYFGLLEEYWSCADSDLRTSPLLPREEWGPLLRRCGFDSVATIGSACPESAADYSLLLARRNSETAACPSPAAEPAAALPRDGWSIVVTRASNGEPARALAEALAEAGARQVAIVTSADDPWTEADTLTLSSRVVLLADDLGGPPSEAVTRTGGLLKNIAAACANSTSEGAEVWVVTGATGLFPEPEESGQAACAAVWGIARTLANEHPSLAIRRVALVPSGDRRTDSARLAAELTPAPGEEDEIVLGPRGRFVPRLRPLSAPSRIAGAGDHYRLRLHRPGRGHRLSWTSVEPQTPGAGEVVIQVRAAALNYRDVMLAEGMLPPGAEPVTESGPQLGLECAGDVVAVGAGVTALAVGDRIFAFGHGTLASHVRVRTEQAGRIPDGMSYNEAATLAAVHLTVQHSLETCARLAAGETVLVHGGAGGIGLAALQCARRAGATVIATAGSPAKRDLLRMLGAAHVFDSRSLSFADDVRTVTEGRGVDVVLNSLAGEAMTRSLECLRPGGRFIELGKRDIYANQPLLLRPFRNNLAYFAVDITRLISDSPAEAAAAFRTVAERVAEGIYRPLPHQCYPAPQIGEALSALRHSRHMGKVVVSFSPGTPVHVEEGGSAKPLAEEGTYLITGGLSGLGAATARHLAARGARHLALVGRRGTASPEATALLADLERQGVSAVVHAADVTDAAGMERIVQQAEHLGHPVRGVVHAAMHLDDAPLEELTAERFRSVLAPKVCGGEILSRLTENSDLDFFVVYSSITAHVGNMHQAPYAAANLHLEALVRDRRRRGLPGLALAWGGISDTGYVARTQIADTITRSGLGLIKPQTALSALDRHLHRDTVTAAIGVMDWDRLAQLLPDLNGPRFSGRLSDTADRSARTAAEELRKRLSAAVDDQARLAVITETLIGAAAHILQTAPERINPAANLADLGLDSLMGVELKLLVQQTFGCDLALMELMAAGTVNGLAQRLHQNLRPTPQR
ncbi:SDR family NAD(P)-dependent oxidoreductase [Streptomyces sp. NBC_00704]|uniref:SDR family NAD(P)-dependent oxidoreductase n=1 Tax=Streptomyces sp. NBC_00704 TaxID=2975809 RepID=UPI002E32E49A|nr:SDR family NAD(P)-dependent oxidoreductase [Streptomyces sp. NBC_00704]